MTWFFESVCLQNRRAVNMDALVIKERVVDGRKLYMAAICDGVGSMSDGGFASATAISMLCDWLENLEEPTQLGPQLQRCVEDINTAVCINSMRKGLKTASTLSCLLLYDNNYYITNVGDSRVYTAFGSKLYQLTQDHSNEGKLTAAIGYKESTVIFCTEGLCRKEQTFIVCSDGLYKTMQSQDLHAAMEACSKKNVHAILRALTEYVLSQGERDNISVILLTNKEK